MDPATITEQSTITIGLLVGSIGALVVATAAFVNLRRDVRELAGRMDRMVTRSELQLTLARLARDNPTMKFPEFQESEA